MHLTLRGDASARWRRVADGLPKLGASTGCTVAGRARHRDFSADGTGRILREARRAMRRLVAPSWARPSAQMAWRSPAGPALIATRSAGAAPPRSFGPIGPTPSARRWLQGSKLAIGQKGLDPDRRGAGHRRGCKRWTWPRHPAHVHRSVPTGQSALEAPAALSSAAYSTC